MRADLHLHTVYSDGIYTPDELALRAKNAGLELVSFTDHDSMEGAAEKRCAAARHGLCYVQGWEVSSYADCKVHVLGYRCGAGTAYKRFLKERTEGALVRAEDMIRKANASLGLSLTLADAEREHLKKDAPLHTMHVVTAFAKKLNADRGALYRDLFEKGKPAYSGLCRPAPEDAIEVIHACGGLAVLAHPGRIDLPFAEREELFDRLVARGLDGIEAVYSSHTEEETEYFKAYAERKNLLQTGGSDFHADDKSVGIPVFYASERLVGAFGLPSEQGANDKGF